MMNRMRRVRSRDDSGMSLAEILVSTMLLGMVSLILMSTMIAGIRTLRGITTRGENTSSVRQGLDRLTQTMRLAIRIDGSTPAFVAAAGNDVTFYSNLSTVDLTLGTGTVSAGPLKLRYYVVAGAAGTACALRDVCLMETATPATKVTTAGASAWTYTATPRTRVIARGIVPASLTAPIFTFAASTNDPLSHATTVAAVPLQADGSVGAGDLASIDRVSLSLSASYTSNPAVPATTARSQVALSNVTSAAPLT